MNMKVNFSGNKNKVNSIVSFTNSGGCWYIVEIKETANESELGNYKIRLKKT